MNETQETHCPLDNTRKGCADILGRGTVHGKFYSSKSKECILEALSLNETAAEPWNLLGRLGGGQVNGRMFSEKECYIRALLLNETNPDAWNNFGSLGGGKVGGRFYTEMKCLEKALALSHKRDKNNVITWTNLGLAGGGNVTGTSYSEQECFEEALSLDSTFAIAWYLLGQVGGESFRK